MVPVLSLARRETQAKHEAAAKEPSDTVTQGLTWVHPNEGRAGVLKDRSASLQNPAFTAHA